MADLVTRDGNIIPDLGTWEREQLNKLYPDFHKPVIKKRGNGRGRKPFDTKNNPMLYIFRVKNNKVAPHWSVRVVDCGLKVAHRVFYDRDYDGYEKRSLAAAVKFRDAEINKILNEGERYID